MRKRVVCLSFTVRETIGPWGLGYSGWGGFFLDTLNTQNPSSREGSRALGLESHCLFDTDLLGIGFCFLVP